MSLILSSEETSQSRYHFVEEFLNNTMPLRALHEPLRTLPHVILTGVLWETRQQFPASFTVKCTENRARHPGTCPDPFRKPRPYFMLRHAKSQGDQYLSILKNPRGGVGLKAMKLARNRARTGTQVWVTGSHVVFSLIPKRGYRLRSLGSSFSSSSVFNKGLIENISLSRPY